MFAGEEGPEFLGELRRRRVFGMTATFIVAVWVMVQVAAEAFTGIGDL